MSRYKLFLREVCSGRLGWGGAYRYGEGVLELELYGERSWHYVQPGSAVLVTLDEEARDVDLLTPPMRYADRILWLCGVPKLARCRSLAQYDTLVELHMAGPVRHMGGKGWQVAEGIGHQGRRYIVAGWVDPAVSDRECRRMLEQVGCVAPKWYVRQVLCRGR